jgi:hypothetical protein
MRPVKSTSPRSFSDSPIRRKTTTKCESAYHQPRQTFAMEEMEEHILTGGKKSSFFSQTEVKPVQNTIQMTPTQPRSNSLSKPLSITPLQKPFFTKHLQNLTILRAKKVIFQCEVRGSPDTDIKWYKDGKQVLPSTDYMIDYDRLTGVCRLSISEAYNQDAGKYSCVANNPAGNDSTTAWLVIRGKNNIAIKIFIRKLNYLDYLLTDPTPEKEQTERTSFETQIFRKTIGKKQVELPKCGKAPIRLGTIESSKVEVQVTDNQHQTQKPVEIVRAYQKFPDTAKKPKIVQPLRDVELIEGGSALFECVIEGHPLNIQWFKGDKELKNQFRHKISFDQKTGLTKLYITTIFEDDADLYTCRAFNSAGEAETSSKLIRVTKRKPVFDDRQKPSATDDVFEPVIF